MDSYRLELNEEMLAWVTRDLAAADADPDVEWKLVFFHNPPYSSGLHGLNPQDPGRWMADRYVPLFQRYGVAMVFSGHSNFYERTCQLRRGECVNEGGIVYVVSGGGGAPLSPNICSGQCPWSKKFVRTRHFVRVEVNGDWLLFEAIQEGGFVMDSFVLETDDTEGNRTYRVADVELQADTVKVEHAFEVLKRHERECLSLEGVVGTGLGVRENPNEAIIEVYAIEPHGVVRAALTDFLEGVEVEVIPGDFDVEVLGKFIDIEEFYSEPVLPATLIPTPTPTPTPTPVPIPRPTPTPTPIPTPDFTLSCLRVVPESLVAGEEVMAEVTVDNEGGVEGTYEVTMLVDGVQVETKEATVTGGGSRTISFLYSPKGPGAGEIDINGLVGSFTALPMSGGRLPIPTGLGDIKMIRPSGLPSSHGGLGHVHGVGYDAKRNTIWAADRDLGNDLFEFDATACDGAKVQALTHLEVSPPPIFSADSPQIEGVVVDPEDDTIYYMDTGGTVRQVGRDGTILRQFNLRESGVPDPGRNWYGIAVQENFLRVADIYGAYQIEKSTGQYTGGILGLEGGGGAYDSDRHLIWGGNWTDGRFEAYDPDTGELVFRSDIVVPPLDQPVTESGKDFIKRHLWGHNLSYGAGRLWVGSEVFPHEVIYGIRVK